MSQNVTPFGPLLAYANEFFAHKPLCFMRLWQSLWRRFDVTLKGCDMRKKGNIL
jgi:hypothetical protein